jgi:GNAT superfamily N-acetyltransferase
VSARRGTPDEAATATEILVDAFYEDPTWSWVFPDPDRRRKQHDIMWSALVGGGMRFDTVWLNADATATAVWIPPLESELSEEQEGELMRVLTDNLDAAELAHVAAVLEAFEDAHPHHEPHFTLSLLGTRTTDRGKGLGLQLLADTLAAMVDPAGMPAYLEASNPVNVALYERYGFQRFGAFTLPNGGPTVATMWRPARR